MFKSYVTVFAFITFLFSFSQNNQDKIWEALLQNDRMHASELYDSLFNAPNSIETFVLDAIVKNENGFINSDQKSIERFSAYKDFEYYLYALWNEDFLFKDYLDSGFNNETRAIIHHLVDYPFKEPMIQQALFYLDAVVSRQERNANRYTEYINKIPAIRQWQFCGVFENLNQSGYDISYEPEEKSYSKADFDANSNGMINWYSPKGQEKESYKFFSNHSEYGSGVHYAQTFFNVDKDIRAVIRIGNSSAFKVWLDDVLIFENAKEITTDLDAFNVEVTIPAGYNRLLIKNAESGDDDSYFIVKITDKAGAEIKDLQFSNSYKEYNKSRFEELNPEVVTHPVEDYFLRKIALFPDDFLFKFCLARLYLRNSKYDEAKDILLPIKEKYPQSSFISKLLILCYNDEKDFNSVNKLKDNMIHDDPDYYISLLYKFQDHSEMSHMSMAELENFLDKFKKSTDSDILKISADFILDLRKTDQQAIKEDIDKLLDAADGWLSVQKAFAGLYENVLSDSETTLKILERLNEKYLDYGVMKSLINKYNKLDRKDKVLDLLEESFKLFPEQNFTSFDLAEQLMDYQKFKEAINYSDHALENYPYSFKAMRIKGDALLKLGEKEEALKYYKQALHYNNEYTELRKKIQDIMNKPDLIEQLQIKDAYKFIEQNRNNIKANNYGYNILLDEAIVILYPEGDIRGRYKAIYEITSDDGVESFKEFNLGLSGRYLIIKGEVVKPDGSIIKADKNGSKFVFKGLEIGDVINFEYEVENRGSGRFYKDYVDYYQFDSYHPCVKTSYTILVPDNIDFSYKVENGELDFKQEKLGDFTKYKWEMNNDPGLPMEEAYMPNTVDIAKYLHISTISDWNKIAFWYSDLVRSQKQINAEVKQAFTSIFPNGVSALSDEEKAKQIYFYIINNFNYSSVPFRQSNFIPQKPSKTINTKLGDCKDLSTLFVTMAQMAGLKANLVLVLTNDYGQNSIVLPSQDFNHCIVKVMIDGKKQFLELTDKDLPFKALPVSVLNATALEIPDVINQSETYNLFKIDDTNYLQSALTRTAKIDLASDNYTMNIASEFEGAINSYYVSVFENPNYQSMKKDIEKTFNNLLKLNFVLDSVYNIKSARGIPKISFSTKLTVNEKADKMGSINIFQLPQISTVYENSVINLSQRNYPIEYTQYETINNYNTEYDIHLDNGMKFIEVPENRHFSFKKHSYSISYKLVKPDNLKVFIEAKTDITTNIEVSDYAQYKAYVENVINAKKSFIGFK